MTRILVVEDSPTQAEKVHLILEDAGFEVETARDGQEGRERLETSIFDLVVSDVVMPRLTGFELCRWMRSDTRTQRTPIILLTTLNDPTDIVQALEAGADNFISKPYEPDYLLARIRSILDNRRFRSDGKLSVNIEMVFMGRRLTIGSGKEQILGLLLSAFEDMVRTNSELRSTKEELETAKEKVEDYAEKLESRARVSEEMYGTLMRGASDAIILSDRNVAIIEANPRAEQLAGRPLSELVGRRLSDLVTTAQRADVERLVGELNVDRNMRWADFVVERRDGSGVEVEASLSLVDVQGRELVFALLRDVTEKRHAERRAVAQHEITQILAEAGTLSEAAPRLLGAMCATLGWEQGVFWQVDRETNGLVRLGTWDATCPGEPDHAAPPLGVVTDPVIGIAGRVRESRSATWISDAAGEGAAARDSGAADEGPRTAVGFPIVSDDRILGVVALLSRKTRKPDDDLLGNLSSFGSQIGQFVERRRAEEALRESEERYRSIFEQARDVILTVGSDRRCSSVSPSVEETTGWKPSEFAGRLLRDFFHPEDLPGAFDVFERATSGQVSRPIDIRVLRKSGDYIDMGLSVTPLRRGNEIELLVLARDITERKRAEAEIRRLNASLEARVLLRTAQLEAANRDLEAFSYSVSHDLRAPLRAIHGFSSILVESQALRLDTEGLHALDVIRQNARRMAQLIDDLLEFSRLGRREVRRSPVELSSLVESIWKELLAIDHGPPAELRLHPLPAVQGDPVLLRQVMENLLSNALKFSSKRETRVVEVGCVEEDGETVFFVRDNGAGFDMRYADKLFGVFQRLHGPSEFEGTGIGLALVKQIVESHGGRVRAVSEVDAGATFFFTLPEGALP